MRILLLTTGLLTGGAERQVMDLAAQWVRTGHAVHVVSLTDESQFPIPDGVGVTFLKLRKNPLSAFEALREAGALVRRWQPDVLHSHMFHANLFARLLRMRDRAARAVPLICTAHSTREGGKLRMALYRVTDRACTLTTHVSAEGREEMIARGAVPAHRIVVMPNGIDTKLFRPDPIHRASLRTAWHIPLDVHLLLSVGRLVPEKAQSVLIEAFARVHAEHPRTRLLIAGDGPLRDALEQEIATAGLTQAITLLGNRNDVPSLMQAADLFVLSSIVEGMPLAVAEALACEVPVVATDVSGVRMLVQDTERIVPPGDSAALATAIANALMAPRSEAYREYVVDNFGLSAVAAGWLTLYRQYGAPLHTSDHA